MMLAARREGLRDVPRELDAAVRDQRNAGLSHALTASAIAVS